MTDERDSPVLSNAVLGEQSVRQQHAAVVDDDDDDDDDYFTIDGGMDIEEDDGVLSTLASPTSASSIFASVSSGLLISKGTIGAKNKASNPPSDGSRRVITMSSSAHQLAKDSMVIKIISASYGPAEGRRLLTGEWSGDPKSSIPFTRDVTPFLRALLIARRRRGMARSSWPSSVSLHGDDDDNRQDEDDDDIMGNMIEDYTVSGDGDSSSESPTSLLRNRKGRRAGDSTTDLVQLTRRNAKVVHLMEGKSMNSIFGDPCPGTSKRLHVHYVIMYGRSGRRTSSDRNSTQQKQSCEVHHASFAEHQRVVLRRNVTLYQDDSKWKHAVATTKIPEGSETEEQDEGDDETSVAALRRARKMGRAQSIAEFEESLSSANIRTPSFATPLHYPPAISNEKASLMPPRSPLSSTLLVTNDVAVENTGAPKTNATRTRKWRLRSAVSEIVLPIVLPFLEVRERAYCQLVCRVWRFVVRNWGVAQSVDIHDPTLFCPDNKNKNGSGRFSRKFLRGILAHSHHSLQSLNLSDFHDLTQDDLHPALPHLRKLASLDISRCHQLDDTTLHLIANHLSPTLEVLYLKGLRKVTDDGLMSVCQSCHKLQVLELSNIPITDKSGICIGENLPLLRALYMRDNYLLTNKSVDVITQKCTRLSQLTLWGCIRLKHVSFTGTHGSTAVVDETMPPSTMTRKSTSIGSQMMTRIGECGKSLVLLNLWGCHSLTDETADSLSVLTNLRSLIASECHRLTDQFLFRLTINVPHLHHLNLRYCKKITDEGIRAITTSMEHLYSLDLSFCTRISSAAIVNLLEVRRDMLAELRLQSCTQLDIVRDRRPNSVARNLNNGHCGRAIVEVLKSGERPSSLSMLDVRNCGGQPNTKEPYPLTEAFVQGLQSIRFEQKLAGLFSRPAVLNEDVQTRLVEHILI